MRHLLRWTLSLVLLFLPAILVAQSQATTGVIEGTVSDATGAVLPGVTITLRNTATNYQQVLVTDSAGRFRGMRWVKNIPSRSRSGEISDAR